jgi:hypothetical protein
MLEDISIIFALHFFNSFEEPICSFFVEEAYLEGRGIRFHVSLSQARTGERASCALHGIYWSGEGVFAAQSMLDNHVANSNRFYLSWRYFLFSIFLFLNLMFIKLGCHKSLLMITLHLDF